MCLSLHLSWLFSRYFSLSLRSLLGLQLLLLDLYLDFPLFLSQVLERDLERDLCLRFLSLLRLRLLFFFFVLKYKHFIFAVDFHLGQGQQPGASPQTHRAPTDGRCSSACPACLHWASELPVPSGHRLPPSHHLHPACSTRTENCCHFLQKG